MLHKKVILIKVFIQITVLQNFALITEYCLINNTTFFLMLVFLLNTFSCKKLCLKFGKSTISP